MFAAEVAMTFVALLFAVAVFYGIYALSRD